MIATVAAIFCGAYILGLLLTGIPGDIAGVPLAAIGLLLLAVPIAFSIRQVWRTAPKPEVWLTASLVGVAAMLYFQIRLPQPNSTDICHAIWVESAVEASGSPVGTSLVKTSSGVAQANLQQVAHTDCLPTIPVGSNQVKVTGKVNSPPRLTRSNRLQFELAATQVRLMADANPSQSNPPMLEKVAVTGNVYVTLPRAAGEQLYPGLTVSITGTLYKPKPASNPGGFDFAKYLAQQGIFTGLNGKTLAYPFREKPAPPLFWAIRQQIQQVQSLGLGQPEGALVSAMVMGKDAVDVPYEVQDQFKQTGLAHALAASGTQVSMLIGVILTLTGRLSSKVRLGLGTAVLILYLGLTGLEPSVLRAGIMGFVALLALIADRKTKPVGSLLLTATLLLLIHPLWIWSLGFQLSFLATLGLLVTVPILTKWFDWMPSAVVPLFAVPIAAYLWTLPLILATFGVVSPYSILVNILVSPLIGVVSIGGMVSAAAALIYPFAGSLLASWLYYPTHLLLTIAEIGSQLPGNTFAVGTIRPAQVVLLYGLVGAIWRWRRLHKYWWLAAMIGIGLVAVPMGYTTANLSQITVLATAQEPVLVIQDSGKVGLIHSGSSEDVQFSVLPFLRQQGINHLDWAIAPNLKSTTVKSWQQISATEPISLFYSSLAPSATISNGQNAANPAYQALLADIKATSGVTIPLSVQQNIQQGTVTLRWIQTESLQALQLQMGEQTWLIFSQLPDWKHQATLTTVLPPATVIGWSGKALSFELLEHLNPELAITFEPSSNPQTTAWFKQHQVHLHSTAESGAIQWTAAKGLTKFRRLEDL
jgi:competence protein ComEC